MKPTLSQIVLFLSQEWSELKDPAKAKGRCTEHMSQLRYVLEYFEVKHLLRRADIYGYRGGRGAPEFLGSHDYVMVKKDASCVDFTLSQFGLELPWPYRGFENPVYFRKCGGLSLMHDAADRASASNLVAKIKESVILTR